MGVFVGVIYFDTVHVVSLSICLRARKTGEVQGSRQIDMQAALQRCACCLVVMPKRDVG